jgi:hypothetical protein
MCCSVWLTYQARHAFCTGVWVSLWGPRGMQHLEVTEVQGSGVQVMLPGLVAPLKRLLFKTKNWNQDKMSVIFPMFHFSLFWHIYHSI